MVILSMGIYSGIVMAAAGRRVVSVMIHMWEDSWPAAWLGARRPVGFAKVLFDQSLLTMEKVG
jgi:hypothetical protein